MTTDIKSIEIDENPPNLATKPSYETKDEVVVDDIGSGASSISDSSASDQSLGLTSTKSREEKVAEAHTTYYPHPTSFKIGEHPIDNYRELRVAVVGAGLSGISAGALLPAKVPGIKLTIFEKNADVVSAYTTSIRILRGSNVDNPISSGRYMARECVRDRTASRNNRTSVDLDLDTLESDVTYPPMYTNRASTQTHNGAKNMRKVPRSEHIGKASRKNMMYTRNCDCPRK